MGIWNKPYGASTSHGRAFRADGVIHGDLTIAGNLQHFMRMKMRKITIAK
jgi:hypothetical protein